jgi:hypothetical protein
MNVIASDFASLKDLAAYKAAKAKGMSDKQAFRVGDNGVGCWGAVTAQKRTPMCALPPDDMIAKFGSIAKAKHARVYVTIGQASVICFLADRMPWKKNIKNGCGIDLNPAALKALGLKSPIKKPATWIWL